MGRDRLAGFKTAEIEDTLEELHDIRRNGPRYSSIGICGNIEAREGDTNYVIMQGILRECFITMGLDKDYPVPAPEPGMSNEDAYHNRFPRWDGAYGEARYMLLDDLINNLELYLAYRD